MAAYIAFTGVLDTNIRVKPETQNVRKIVDASGTLVSAPTAFASTRVTNNRGAILANTNNSLLLAASAPASLIHGTVTTTNGSGLVIAAPVVWHDGATGTLTQVADGTRPALVASYIVTHILGGITKTYAQPTITRDASGFITTIPAITVS